MTPEQIFDLWAPQGARWSQWAKPVLFAHLGSARESPVPTTGQVEPAAPLPSSPPLAGIGPADGTTGLFVDLPGATGVAAGLVLAEKGYRPVPLYNAVPSPSPAAPVPRGAVAVDMADVLDGLRAGAERIQSMRLRDDSPPAFLLDSRRRIGDPAALRPGAFDNRSVSLPTDFPSANLLLASGIRRVIVVQLDQGQPQADLAHTLRRWQDAGMEVMALATGAALADLPEGTAASPRPIVVNKPRWYRHLWHAMLARLGLRPNPLGGFGGFLPVPSAG
jgi:hypothetical protein